MKSNELLHIRRKREFLTAILISFIVLLLFSSLSSYVGDNYLKNDHINKALLMYKISKLTNPFNPSIDQRILATQSITDERLTESEETSSTNNEYAQIPNTIYKNVLGISIQVPVLMLHYVRINPNPADKIGFNLSVTPDDFAKQMDYLVQQGYHAISLDEMGAALLHGFTLPKKPIVITFDDSYEDSYTKAYPILKARGLKGVNFVITGFVGAPGYLTWDEIHTMQNSGVFTFGSHTATHRPLTSLSNDEIKKEVTDSKQTLQAHLHNPIYWLAYPFGNVNDRVASIVQQSGYVGAFGTNAGSFLSDNRLFTLPRVRDSGGLGLSGFISLLP